MYNEMCIFRWVLWSSYQVLRPPIVLLNPASENSIKINVDISSHHWNNGYYYNWKTRLYEGLQPSMSILISELVIKAVTCVALIIGAVKLNEFLIWFLSLIIIINQCTVCAYTRKFCPKPSTKNIEHIKKSVFFVNN